MSRKETMPLAFQQCSCLMMCKYLSIAEEERHERVGSASRNVHPFESAEG